MIALILAAALMTAAFIPWAVRNDRADAHLIPCPECEES